MYVNYALQNINNIKNIITSKFKEKLWCEKYLEAKCNEHKIIIK